MTSLSSIRKSGALTVKVPISSTYSANSLSKRIHSLEGVTEDLNSLTSYELNLVIISARDSENIGYPTVHLVQQSSLQPALDVKTQNLQQVTLQVVNSDNLKIYAQAVTSSDPLVSYKEIRLLMDEEEQKRQSAITEEKVKLKREKNVIVYGLPEVMSLPEVTDEFNRIALEINYKPVIVKADRLGNFKMPPITDPSVSDLSKLI